MNIQAVAVTVYVLFFTIANVLIFTNAECLNNESVILVLEIISFWVMVFFMISGVGIE